MSPNVLVVGAGPVGLMVALRLAQAGIKVDVVEKEDRLLDEPRAIGYHVGALASLQRAGLIEDMLKVGFVGRGLCWRKPIVDDGKGGKKHGDAIAYLPVPSQVDPPHGINGTLYLSQGKLVQIMYKRIAETGLVTVHFNTALTSIEQFKDYVVATVTNKASGDTSTMTASFLVGADGGKSRTRNLLDIAFRGHSWPEYIVATDFLYDLPDIDAEFPTSLIIHPINYGLLTPLEPFAPGKRTTFRCSVGVDPSETSKSVEELTSDSYVRNLLDLMLPGPRPIQVEITKSVAYRTHQLCASSFRRGRCILAGDAAHLNHPWGAMGLSTGLIDGEALADVLEMIIAEGKSEDLLNVYAQERQQSFQLFVNPQSTQNKLRASNNPDTAHEDWLLSKLANPTPEALAEF